MLAQMPQGHAAAPRIVSNLALDPATPFRFVQGPPLGLEKANAMLLSDALDEPNPSVSFIDHGRKLG